jgi:hypothetical protein
VLALSTTCAREERLDLALRSFRGKDVRAVALHRPPTPEEAAALAPLAKRVRIAAVFADRPDRTGPDVGCRLFVVEGGAAGGDREASLEDLCRRLHALSGRGDVALRAPAEPGGHPAPHEIELVREALPFVGYWHEPDRADSAYLDVAARWLLGASFRPLETDLGALRDALPRGGLKVVVCAPEELDESLRCARSFFRA